MAKSFICMGTHSVSYSGERAYRECIPWRRSGVLRHGMPMAFSFRSLEPMNNSASNLEHLRHSRMLTSGIIAVLFCLMLESGPPAWPIHKCGSSDLY